MTIQHRRRKYAKCRYCGFRATTWDHVIPRVKGGTGARWNLSPSCWPCNQGKAGHDVEDWEAWLETPEGVKWKSIKPEVRKKQLLLPTLSDGTGWRPLRSSSRKELSEEVAPSKEMFFRPWPSIHGWDDAAIAEKFGSEDDDGTDD